MNHEDRDRLIRIDEHVGILVTRANDHSKRLKSIEIWRALVTGGAAIVGFAVYVGRDILVEWVKGKMGR